MPSTSHPLPNPPAVDLRLGGLRLTIQRLPYPLLTFLTGIAGSAGGAMWFGR